MSSNGTQLYPALEERQALNRLLNFKQGKIPVTGGSLHYVAGGQGERTIVLLHKLGGWAWEWRWILPTLAEHARTIAVDLTGHGDTVMHGDPPYIATQEELAAQVMALLDSLGEDKVTLIGSSLGGCIGAVCGVFWPNRVDALITAGSAIAAARSRESLVKSDRQYIEGGMFDAEDNPLPRDPIYMTPTFGMRDTTHMDDMVRSRNAAGRWIQPCTRGVAIFDHLAIAPRVTCPVLMLYGTLGAYGRFVGDAVARFPNARGAAIGDASAFPHQDRPDHTAQAIFEFLNV